MQTLPKPSKKIPIRNTDEYFQEGTMVKNQKNSPVIVI